MTTRLETRKEGRAALIAVLALHIVIAGLYWHYTPYGAAPDEEAHGAYVGYLAAEHRLPVLSGDVTYEAHQPPLYYALGVPFYAVGKALGLGRPDSAVRALSLVLGALAVLVTYATVRNAVPGHSRLALGVAAFVAFLPMRLTLSSSVNNDMLTELIFGVALLLITRILGRGLAWRDTVLLGITLGLGILTKTTCVLLFPVALMALWRHGTAIPDRLKHSGVVLGIALLIGGWWIVRNGVLYGDPLAISAFGGAFGHTATPEYWLMERGFTLGMYVLLVAGWTFASFWGVFGQMNVFMSFWVYALLGILTVPMIVASVPAARVLRRSGQIVAGVTGIYTATLVLVLLSFIAFNLKYFQAQGRYLYPALIPMSFFWVLGFERLLPERMKRLMPSIIAVGMLALALGALFTSLAPGLRYAY